MSTSTNLQKTLLVESGAGNYLLANDFYYWIDALLGGVVDRTAATPASPAAGDLYIINGTPTGTWATDTRTSQDLALYLNGAWNYITPPASKAGLRVWVRDEAKTYVWNGTVWNPEVRAGLLLNPYWVEYATAAAGTRNNHRTLDFDQTTEELGVWTAFVPRNYGSAGLTVDLYWTSTATAGAVVWGIEIEVNGVAFDIDADDFGTQTNSASAGAPASSGQIVKTTITVTDGPATDNLSPGDPIRIRISRVTGDAGDTMAADAQLLKGIIYETGAA